MVKDDVFTKMLNHLCSHIKFTVHYLSPTFTLHCHVDRFQRYTDSVRDLLIFTEGDLEVAVNVKDIESIIYDEYDDGYCLGIGNNESVYIDII